MNESAQKRRVEVIEQYGAFSYGRLSSPVTFPGFYPAPMNRSPSAPEPGQNLTVVGYGGQLHAMYFDDAEIEGVDKSTWPGPALATTLIAGTEEFCTDLLNEYPTLKPADTSYENTLCGVPSSADDAQPCAGTSASGR
jgi:hypothetical protein